MYVAQFKGFYSIAGSDLVIKVNGSMHGKILKEG